MAGLIFCLFGKDACVIWVLVYFLKGEGLLDLWLETDLLKYKKQKKVVVQWDVGWFESTKLLLNILGVYSQSI